MAPVHRTAFFPHLHNLRTATVAGQQSAALEHQMNNTTKNPRSNEEGVQSSVNFSGQQKPVEGNEPGSDDAQQKQRQQEQRDKEEQGGQQRPGQGGGSAPGRDARR